MPEETKKPDEKAYHCPNCNQAIKRNQEICDSCEATIGWDEDE